MYEDYKNSLYFIVNNAGGGSGPGHKKVPPILKVVAGKIKAEMSGPKSPPAKAMKSMADAKKAMDGLKKDLKPL